MFEKFLSANADDFRQRYLGTFGFFRKEDGTKLLTRLDTISGRGCSFSDVRGVTYNLEPDSKLDIGFEFLPPKSGFFNTAIGTVLVIRIPARQFQRGVSPNNTALHLLSGKQQEHLPLDFPIMEKIYEKNTTLEQAFEEFKQKKTHSVALSSQIALDRARLWVLDEPIGECRYSNGTFKVKLKAPDFWLTETTDAFKATAHPFEVN